VRLSKNIRDVVFASLKTKEEHHGYSNADTILHVVHDPERSTLGLLGHGDYVGS